MNLTVISVFITALLIAPIAQREEGASSSSKGFFVEAFIGFPRRAGREGAAAVVGRVLQSSSPTIESSSSSKEWTSGGKVSVIVERTFPATGAIAVQDAWLEYHWRKGGGLPIFVWITNKNYETMDHAEPKRLLAPIMMEETLLLNHSQQMSLSSKNLTESRHLLYQVSKNGPFFQSDMVPNSHQGRVSFHSVPSDSGTEECQMTWEVEFETTRFRTLYQLLTEFCIATATRTVAEAVAIPQLLTLQTTLQVQPTADSPWVRARKEWLEFFWARGGGLPLPPPISFGVVLDEGGGTARKSIFRIPPLLVDSVVETSTTVDSASAIYQIENPGWTTFPFLIHTHLGRVQFQRTSQQQQPSTDHHSVVDMIWEIQVRPFPFMAPIVQKLLEMTASTIMRNLRVHMVEPRGTVNIKAPRGQKLYDGRESLGSVPKDIWLGGVLDAHLRDNRSTWAQTLSIFQPWTWGRSGDGGETDEVQFQWTHGEIKR
jgi:hypothetical protein